MPRVLRAAVTDYMKRSGIEIVPHLEIDNFAMAISLVASTRGVALLPASAENFLKWSVISRPLKGEAPTIKMRHFNRHEDDKSCRRTVQQI